MANVTYTVPNKVGSYDGDMVVKQYTSLTINSGDTITTDQPCRGMFIYVQGDCTINGTLTMSARGASASPSNSGGSDNNSVQTSGLRYGFFKGGQSDTLTMDGTSFNGCGTAVRTAIASATSGSGTNYKVHTVNRADTSGSPRPSVGTNGTKEYPIQIQGGNSTGNQRLGGGGAGGQAYEAYNGQGGAGGNNTCFSGGSAGGGAAGGGAANSGHRGVDANNSGGQGGKGGDHNESSGSRPSGTGGAGNPGGASGLGVSESNNVGQGNGGVIWLVVGGNLTIGSSGMIHANGKNGEDSTATADNSSMGGGSGGGHIAIMCGGTVTANSVTISEGDYIGTAGATIGSATAFGEQDYNLQCWGGKGGDNGANANQNLYTGNAQTRNGGTGGKGAISIYSL